MTIKRDLKKCSLFRTQQKMATLVPKEYVRQQLKSMGITEISEEELESYTKGKLKFTSWVYSFIMI